MTIFVKDGMAGFVRDGKKFSTKKRKIGWMKRNSIYYEDLTNLRIALAISNIFFGSNTMLLYKNVQRHCSLQVAINIL